MFKPRRKQSIVARASRPVIEGLEKRCLLSASLTHHGVLNVIGTGHADTIDVSMDASAPTMLDVTIDGKTASFDSTLVNTIKINAGGGADSVTLDSSVTTASTVMGSGGSDTLVAGGGDDSLNGGAGNDSLEGGAGNDTLSGGAGNDTVIGGTGSDTMTAGAGNDSLKGGAGDCTLQGGNGHDTLVNGTGADSVNAGKGKAFVDFNPNGGVALSTLPAAVQTGLTTLAQGATISSVLTFQEDGKTFYGTKVSINGVDTRIIVDATGAPVTQSADNGRGEEEHSGGFGSVVSVDTSSNTITIGLTSEHGPSRQTTFKVTAATTITADDTTIPLTSLTTGEWVNVQTSSSDATTATSITAVNRRVEGTVTAVDTGANTITLTDESGAATTYTLNANATVDLDGASSALAAIMVNFRAEITLSALDGTALSIEAKSGNNDNGNPTEGQDVSGVVASVDTTGGSITLTNESGASTTYSVTSSTAIFVNGNAGALGDIPVGASVELSLAADGITVIAIKAEMHDQGGGGGEDQHAGGAIVSVDTTANTITLTDGGKTATFNVTSATSVTLDGATSSVAALTAGVSAELTLAADGVTVLSIQADSHNDNGGHRDGASGAIVSIDTVANTITLQGEQGASAAFNVTSATTVMLDGAPSTFSALVAGDFAGLKLAADGETVVSISAESRNSGEQHDTSGPVASVDTVANTITLQRDGGVTATYNFTSTTTVTLDGASSTPAALVAGDSAELKLAADGVTVISISAESQNPQHDTSGPIASIDTAGNTITLQRDGGMTATYNFTSTTTVTLDGASSSPAALVAGDFAELKLAADGVTVLSIQAESQNPQQHDASGPIVSVNTVANTITLHHGDGDATATYNLTSTTTVTLDGASSTPAALVAGDAADLKLTADGVTVVSIQAETRA